LLRGFCLRRELIDKDPTQAGEKPYEVAEEVINILKDKDFVL
jgi:hypothetical protein